MARTTQTTYTCDGCGRKVSDGKQLGTFVLERIVRGRKWLLSDKADLCDSCESNLIAAVEPILGASVVDLRREAETEQASKRSRARR